MRHLHKQDGFGLIELTVLIVILAVLAAIAMQSMTPAIQDARIAKAKREMKVLAHAIAGNPNLATSGRRSDFGYVGDVGAFPPDLDALYRNPGGFSTWDGPYVSSGFIQDTLGHKIDEWGQPYAYSGALTITSTGSGNSITLEIPGTVDDYLYNSVRAIVTDQGGNPPGAALRDSVTLILTHPDGSGGMRTCAANPDPTGMAVIDSVPAGNHRMLLIFEPTTDTLTRYLNILPGHRETCRFKFASDLFSAVTSADGGYTYPSGNAYASLCEVPCTTSTRITIIEDKPRRSHVSEGVSRPAWGRAGDISG